MDGYTSNQLFKIVDPATGAVNNNPNRKIPLDKCLEILDDCKAMGVKAVQLTGGGEPCVHPQHRAVMQAVLDRGMDLALVTNGTIFKDADTSNRSTIDLLLQAKWVRISIDAGAAETYASMREVSPAMFPRVWDNVKALVAARKEYVAAGNPCDLVIGIGFVVTKENYREISHAAVTALEAGVDNFRISAVFQTEGEKYFAEFHEQAYRWSSMAAMLDRPTFRVFNNYSARVNDLTTKNPDYSFCGYQQFNTYIGATLDVFRCCQLAYNERGKIGSIANQRFRTLWESEQKRQAFADFDARGCERCQFHGANKSILYAIDANPPHVNFV